MILQGSSLGKIEFDIMFEKTSDRDGDFIRCIVYNVPSYDYVIGPWMRSKDKAFKEAMYLILKDEKVSIN
jgi:hypothetical protein